MSKNHSQGNNVVSTIAPTSTSPVISESNDDTTVVNISLQQYLVPLAIVANAVIIAVAILLAGRGGATNGNGTATTTVTPTTTTAAAGDTNNTASKTAVADSPYIGNRETAKIAIVEYSDYECPFCQRHHKQVYPDIYKNYIENGKAIYVFKNYIAVPGHNPAATTEAYAALCVRELAGNDNAKYFQMNDLLYTNTKANGGGLPDGMTVYSLAAQLGVNSDQLKTCIDSAKFAATITADEAAGNSAGIQGTPGFVVGKLSADGTVEGKLIAGAYPFTEFQRISEEMLAK